MRITEYSINGKTFHLLLNGNALFAIYEKFGDKGSVLDPITENNREAFLNACWFLATLAAEGEKYRRYEGMRPGLMPSPDWFQTNLAPMEIINAKKAIKDAVVAGFLRNETENETRDPFMEEIQKKTEQA